MEKTETGNWQTDTDTLLTFIRAQTHKFSLGFRDLSLGISGRGGAAIIGAAMLPENVPYTAFSTVAWATAVLIESVGSEQKLQTADFRCTPISSPRKHFLHASVSCSTCFGGRATKIQKGWNEGC